MFKPMDQDLARKLISEHDDVLTAEAKAEETLYRHTQCPLCGQSGCEKRVRRPQVVVTENGPEVVASPFGDDMLPEGYAHCVHCDTDFNPRTGMIFKTEASMIHAPPTGFPPTQ